MGDDDDDDSDDDDGSMSFDNENSNYNMGDMKKSDESKDIKSIIPYLNPLER